MEEDNTLTKGKLKVYTNSQTKSITERRTSLHPKHVYYPLYILGEEAGHMARVQRSTLAWSLRREFLLFPVVPVPHQILPRHR